ncbi:3-ketosteroid 9alpha-monooxygenase subunit A [Nocardia amikacinitolerans]|uniref:Rieske-type oxygenase n=1 Tax=Nocardia amikacinitolerans TaxID=756689 RepID=A0A285KSW1_9NOCA|nr:Rieske 2Fe-2S domain-containing protein [Nocardia amikacinitolerans]MCP2275731.1 3-ketosteroid 9alpha-monooxygenase subunit A [Nocardia amikacinitolerans]SNY75752.1 3-ketosteroid 9alpha-monooxygenase subunit A [Nocardia amikacinitolerans]
MTIREIDSGTAFIRYARGWHCLGLADAFRDGKPHAITAFGTKLVVFADSNGTLRVLDGYCRHMGGDLSMGTVKGDDVACPFHDWRWGGDGRCTSIPYAKRVPPLARTRSWTTLERNQQLFVWHDIEGNPPQPQVEIPQIEGMGTELWSEWSWNSILIEDSHCREIVDNNVDMAHFFYIHHAYPVFFKNVFDGHIASQYLHSKARADTAPSGSVDENALLRSEAHYFGPSYMINYLHNDFGDRTVEVVLINCHYPVTQDSFVLQWGVSVQQLPGLPADKAAALAVKFGDSFGTGFLEDVEIWRNKTRIDNPLLCKEDGPVYQQRRWYEQFYVDVADITDDMTARFEYEVDTTLANQAWKAEVAANLADRRPTAN